MLAGSKRFTGPMEGRAMAAKRPVNNASASGSRGGKSINGNEGRAEKEVIPLTKDPVLTANGENWLN